MDLVVFFFWLFFCFVAAAIASNKGRGAGMVFLLSLFLTPVVGIIVALVMKRDNDTLTHRDIKAGKLKKCPFCAETIKPDAIICRYCGKDMPKADEQLTISEMKQRGIIK